MIKVGVCFMHNTGFSGDIALGLNDVAINNSWMLRFDANWVYEDLPECDVYVMGPSTLDEPSVIARNRLAELKKRPVVAVEIDLSSQGIVSILCDHVAVGQAAAEHLLKCGIQDFAGYGYDQWPVWMPRRAGFRAAIERAGKRYLDSGDHFRPSWAPVADPAHDTEFTFRRLADWIRTLPKPVGLFTGDDNWAEALWPRIFEAGREIPTDIAIVGTGNSAIVCELARPSLSSVIIPWRQMGRQAGELLKRILEGEKVEPRQILVPPAGVVARHSTDMLAVPDEDVAAALAFIQRKAVEGIDVEDVLREVPVYRRRLEIGFKKHVGHGIMREIRRVRVERAKQLIALGNLSITEVAQHTGFVNATKLTQIFGKFAGMTPTAYRNQFRIRS